jgi:hypothetical protein
MSPGQPKVKPVPYPWPLPELQRRAAAGKRYHWVPTLCRSQERDLAAIRLILSVVVQQAEEGKTASNWNQQLAQHLGWATNLVLKLKRKKCRYQYLYVVTYSTTVLKLKTMYFHYLLQLPVAGTVCLETFY